MLICRNLTCFFNVQAKKIFERLANFFSWRGEKKSVNYRRAAISQKTMLEMRSKKSNLKKDNKRNNKKWNIWSSSMRQAATFDDQGCTFWRQVIEPAFLRK